MRGTVTRENAQGDKFTFFWGGPLSQWHTSEFRAVCPFEKDGPVRTFSCAEQWMMFCKAHLMGDAQTAEAILAAQSPAAIKKLGRAVRGWKQALWDEHALDIVIQGNVHKFSQNAQLKQALLATSGTILAEASPYDKVWGIGMSSDHPLAGCITAWPGKNMLGAALAEVRKRLEMA